MTAESFQAEKVERAKEFFKKRASDYRHYQHLNTLPNFKDKLDYCQQYVILCTDDLASSRHYTEELTKSYCEIFPNNSNLDTTEIEPAFILTLEPKTDQDRRELHKFWLDLWREKDAKENWPVDKFGYQWSPADKIKIAFRVKPFEALRADLEARIRTSTNGQNLLLRELALTTDAIDSAGRTVNGVMSTWADVIIELRDSYVLNRPYDLSFSGDLDPLNKIVRLAKVWDIIEYEAYLKDRVTGLQNSQPNPALALSVPPANDDRKNDFNLMPLYKVKQWFMQLETNNSSNGRPFLTDEQVEQFIERAFVGDVNLQKLSFNMAHGERTSITKLFYLFFQRCINDYASEPTKQCKEKYVRLLTDNFTNYNYNTVFSTFNNSRNAPIQWKETV